MSILDRVNSPEDIKKLDFKELKILSKEIRQFLILNVSKTGGHLASNLGVVELTLALHKVFNSPQDKIVFDVGHQSYVHKIITGRKDKIDTLRQLNGLSGFPKPSESIHDAFITGHSSTSVSAALGLANADILKGGNNYSIAVIGDGALTGGMAFEALNNAGRSKAKIIVILNDNEMSISKNVGAIAKYLSRIRNASIYFDLKDTVFKVLSKIPFIGKRIIIFIMKWKSGLKESLYHNTMFEDMGFSYLGPVDGHNTELLCKLLERAKKLKKPVFLHVTTVKGKGFTDAENHPELFHGITGTNGKQKSNEYDKKKTYSEHFGEALLELAKKDNRICAVTAAMTNATGLLEFSQQIPDRFFDVGIAEQHAVTFSAGLASAGFIPVFAVYSSFLQRGYDQIVHDVALPNLKVVFGIDRAGIVGEDGDTHQGIFDVSFLDHIPNLTMYAPSNGIELKSMLKRAIYETSGPAAIRYPRGEACEEIISSNIDNDFDLLQESDDKNIILVSFGKEIYEVYKASQLLMHDGIKSSILKINKIKPINNEIIEELKKYKNVLFVEECIKIGGIGQLCASELAGSGINYYHLAIENFVTHGSCKELLKLCSLDSEGIEKFIKDNIVK